MSGDLKRFMARGLCFAAVWLAMLAALNHFYVRTNGYKSLDCTFKFYLVPDGIQVANLGSSHGEYGLDYSGIRGVTGFNFALSGQSLYSDLQVLEKFADRLAEGCTVIIPLSYFSFVQARDHNNQHVLYYRWLDYGSIQNRDPVEYVRFRLLPVINAGFNLKYLIRDKKAVEFHYIPSMLGDNVEEFRKYARLHLQYCRDLMHEGGYEAFNRENLEGIIRLCLERGFRPVLITTPYTRYYNELFSQEFLDGFHATISDICHRYGLTYLDYSHDPRFAETLEWFVDSDHLNDKGRKAFTEILLKDLGVI